MLFVIYLAWMSPTYCNSRQNVFDAYEYLAWIFTNAPNLGKPGYASTIEDLLPGSAALPQKVIIPEPKETKPEKYAWEED
jgi:transposase